MELKVKSIASFVPIQTIEESLSDMGFILTNTSTVVSDGKFWNKMLFVRGEEMIFISDEIGDVYPKDPIITIYGFNDTIENIIKVFS